MAKVESLEAPAEKADYWVCTLSDFKDHVYESVAKWAEACKAVGAVVADGAAAATAAKDGDKPAEEEKKEGEGDAEKPPAE